MFFVLDLGPQRLAGRGRLSRQDKAGEEMPADEKQCESGSSSSIPILPRLNAEGRGKADAVSVQSG